MYQRQNAVFVLWAVSVVVIAFFLIPGIAPRLVITDFANSFQLFQIATFGVVGVLCRIN